MEVLIVWLMTILTSLTMNLITGIRIYKDAANCGYKINFEKTDIDQNENNVILKELLNPLINIRKAYDRAIEYKMSTSMSLEKLIIQNILIKMSIVEENEYKKHPNTLKIIKITIKSFKTQEENQKILKYYEEYINNDEDNFEYDYEEDTLLENEDIINTELEKDILTDAEKMMTTSNLNKAEEPLKLTKTLKK